MILHALCTTWVLAVAATVPAEPTLEQSPSISQESKIIEQSYGGPIGILRFVDPNEKSHRIGVPDIEAQNRIIAASYSPAFLRPEYLLDYRVAGLEGRTLKSLSTGPVVVLPYPGRQRPLAIPPGFFPESQRPYDDPSQYQEWRRLQELRSQNRHHNERDHDDRDRMAHKLKGRDRNNKMIDDYKIPDLMDGVTQLDDRHRNDHRDSSMRKHGWSRDYNPAWARMPEVSFNGRHRTSKDRAVNHMPRKHDAHDDHDNHMPRKHNAHNDRDNHVPRKHDAHDDHDNHMPRKHNAHDVHDVFDGYGAHNNDYTGYKYE